MKIIPVSDSPAFRERVLLDEKPYLLDFEWNVRESYWTLGIYDEEGIPILTGTKIVLGYELLRDYVSPALPPGGIVAIDLTSKLSKIGRNDLNSNKIRLVYIERDEW